MSYWEWFFRFCAGGFVVVVTTLLGRSKYPFLAGMAILFPAVTAVALYFISQVKSAEETRRIILFSLYSLPTIIVFLLGTWAALKHYHFNVSLSIGLTAWFATAVLLYFLEHRVLRLMGGE